MSRAMKTLSSRRSSDHPAASAVARRDTAWTIRRARGLQIVESRALAKLGWLVHGFSTRPGGGSLLDGKPALNLGFTDWDERARVAANRETFVAAIGAKQMPLVTLRQIHSDVIHVAAAPAAEAANQAAEKPGIIVGRGFSHDKKALFSSGVLTPEAPDSHCSSAPKADTVTTSARGLLLGVQTADCVPILLADTRQHAIAAIHAGWRGTLARIVVKTLGRMRMEFGTRPRDVVAALGPAIGRCCYEVGPEVAQAYAAQFPTAADWFDGPFEQLAHGEEPLWLPWLTMMPPGHVPPPPRVQLDLRAANRWQLADAGVPESKIAVSDLCTACRTDLLFSYRREGAKTGRMMAMIGISGGK